MRPAALPSPVQSNSMFWQALYTGRKPATPMYVVTCSLLGRPRSAERFSSPPFSTFVFTARQHIALPGCSLHMLLAARSCNLPACLPGVSFNGAALVEILADHAPASVPRPLVPDPDTGKSGLQHGIAFFPLICRIMWLQTQVKHQLYVFDMAKCGIWVPKQS